MFENALVKRVLDRVCWVLDRILGWVEYSNKYSVESNKYSVDSVRFIDPFSSSRTLSKLLVGFFYLSTLHAQVLRRGFWVLKYWIGLLVLSSLHSPPWISLPRFHIDVEEPFVWVKRIGFRYDSWRLIGSSNYSVLLIWYCKKIHYSSLSCFQDCLLAYRQLGHRTSELLTCRQSWRN